MNASAKDLRFHTAELLAAVERGEEVIITYRGEPKARLVPMAHKDAVAQTPDRSAFGIWKDRSGLEDVNTYVRRLRQRRHAAIGADAD